jgi:hypothetical protein
LIFSKKRLSLRLRLLDCTVDDLSSFGSSTTASYRELLKKYTPIYIILPRSDLFLLHRLYFYTFIYLDDRDMSGVLEFEGATDMGRFIMGVARVDDGFNGQGQDVLILRF